MPFLNVPHSINFSPIIKAGCLLSILVFCLTSPIRADQLSSQIVTRPELAVSLRHELASKLRQITGLKGLDFDENGALGLGNIKPVGGSQTARELLAEAVAGRNMIVLEDASHSEDVVFCRVVEGKWKTGADQKPPVYVLSIDFADFAHVMGDEAALAAFDVGWGVLHEVEHVVHDAVDPLRAGEAGDCEALINKMRRECGLAERSDYYFTYVPGTINSSFKTRIVRLAFDLQKPETKNRKRYWLIWDAALVGGLKEQGLLAARR